MPSVAKQMNDMLAEIRSVRQLLDEEIRRSSADHDDQIRIKSDVEFMKGKIIEVEKRIKEKLADFDECLKDTKKKKWEILIAIFSSFVTAIAGIIVYRAFYPSQNTTPPPPDPRPHSSLYVPAEPRPFLFLRGTGRGSQNPSC